MAKYTTQVLSIVRANTIDDENLTLLQRIDKACPKIFNFDFPIWDENYRLTLERKIIMHYLMKEIGLETVELWKLFLNERLNLIMPYYVQLYETTQKEYNYIWDTDGTETYTGTNDKTENSNRNSETNFTGTGENTTNGNRTSESNTLLSDTPQANYNGLDYATNLDENKTTDNTESTTNVSNTSKSSDEITNELTANENNKYTRTRVGKFGGKSITELIVEYRQAILNIDRMIIEELGDLFMMVE